ADVVAKMDRARDLVDVLAARALRPDGGDLRLGRIDPGRTARSHRRCGPQRRLTKKVQLRPASSMPTSSWPAWRVNCWKSRFEPGSVAMIFRTWPLSRVDRAFFARRMGK